MPEILDESERVRSHGQHVQGTMICDECAAVGFKHRRLELYYCRHQQALRLYDGSGWFVLKPCTRSEARRICVSKSLRLWDALADTHSTRSNLARRRSFNTLDRLSSFLDGLREAE